MRRTLERIGVDLYTPTDRLPEYAAREIAADFDAMNEDTDYEIEEGDYDAHDQD